MPQPINTTRTGTGWTVDVTTLALSTDLGTKDFFIKVGGVASVLTTFTKTSSVLLTYSGVALASNTPIVIWRDSIRLVDDFTFGEVNSSAGLNLRFTQLERVVEDLRNLFTP